LLLHWFYSVAMVSHWCSNGALQVSLLCSSGNAVLLQEC
jgi:hypothetical protein